MIPTWRLKAARAVSTVPAYQLREVTLRFPPDAPAGASLHLAGVTAEGVPLGDAADVRLAFAASELGDVEPLLDAVKAWVHGRLKARAAIPADEDAPVDAVPLDVTPAEVEAPRRGGMGRLG